MFEQYTIPLTLEEQACLLLYARIRRSVRDTQDDHRHVRDAILSIVTQFARAIRDEDIGLSQDVIEDGTPEKVSLSERAREVLEILLWDALEDGTIGRIYQKCTKKTEDHLFSFNVESELRRLLADMRNEHTEHTVA